MQTEQPSITLGLLPDGGGGLTAWQRGQVRPRPSRRDAVTPAHISLLEFSTRFHVPVPILSEKCLMMLMYLQTQEQSLLLLYKAINVHKLCLNGLVSFFSSCAE